MAHARVVLLSLLLAAGCAAPKEWSTVPADHPASPDAPETPVALPPDTLASVESRTVTPTRAPPTTSPLKPGAAVYTCPMHPEVRMPAPGNCPKCGMTLVLEKASDEEKHR